MTTEPDEASKVFKDVENWRRYRASVAASCWLVIVYNFIDIQEGSCYHLCQILVASPMLVSIKPFEGKCYVSALAVSCGCPSRRSGL